MDNSMQPMNYDEVFRRLTDNASESLRRAAQYALKDGSRYVGTEYLLLGIIGQRTSFAAQILSGAGLTFARARKSLVPVKPGSNSAKLPSAKESVMFSETTKLTLKMSIDIAKEFQQAHCGTEHILFSLLSQKNSRSRDMLNDANVDIGKLQSEVEDFLYRQQSETSTSEPKPAKSTKQKSLLDAIAIDLTGLARKGRIDTVVGRDREIDRLMVILGRKRKNNPVLIGEPGVGKTAIVEGLAARIASDNVPEGLVGKSIYQLELSNLIAGTKYRGEFEDRLQKVISHLRGRSDVMLFIDEIHQLVGTGSAEGSMDAANILKPALARGEIRLIGATTTDEFSKHIEGDQALDRRLQKVIVGQPSPRETAAILRGVRRHYEKHHGVKIDDEVLDSVIDLSDRYLSERYFPDKAIDVIDEAASEKRISKAALPAAEKELLQKVRAVQSFIAKAVEDEDYQRAAKNKIELVGLENKLSKLQEARSRRKAIPLSVSDVTRTVARLSGVSTLDMESKTEKRLLNLDKQLKSKVIDQSEAVDLVVKSVRRSAVGISRNDKPQGSFIFSGPSGVGKTELAKQLAISLFGSTDSLLKVDMSEMGEKHSVARMVGAPAGYVGYGDKSQVADFVRRRPHSIILFDEIEKAHPDIFNIFLQILDEGKLTDGKGRKIDFTKSIIIMTSNLGAEAFASEAKLGFAAKTKSDEKDLVAAHEANSRKVTKSLAEHFRPEFINRLDKIVVFKPLTKKTAAKIAKLQIENLRSRLERKGVGVKVSTAATRVIVKEGFSEKSGARGIDRAIVDHIEDPLALQMLSGEIGPGSLVNIDSKDGKIEISSK